MNNQHPFNKDQRDQIRDHLSPSSLESLKMHKSLMKALSIDSPLSHTIASPFAIPRRSLLMRSSVAVLGLLVTIGGTISGVAASSLPGQTLYGVKVNVNEELTLLLQPSDTDRLTYEIKRAQKRISEAEKLAEQKKLNEKNTAIIEKNIKGHADKIITDSHELILSAPEEHKELTKDFTEVLDNAEITFTAIAREEERERTRNQEALEKVKNTLTPDVEDIISDTSRENTLNPGSEINSVEETEETEESIEEDIKESDAKLAVLDGLLATTQYAQKAVKTEQEVAVALQEENNIVVLESTDSTAESTSTTNEDGEEAPEEGSSTATVLAIDAAPYRDYIDTVTIYGEEMSELLAALDPSQPITPEVVPLTPDDNKIATDQNIKPPATVDASILEVTSSLADTSSESLGPEEIKEVRIPVGAASDLESIIEERGILKLPNTLLDEAQILTLLNLGQELQDIREYTAEIHELINEDAEISHEELNVLVSNIASFDTNVRTLIKSTEIESGLTTIPALPIFPQIETPAANKEVTITNQEVAEEVTEAEMIPNSQSIITDTDTVQETTKEEVEEEITVNETQREEGGLDITDFEATSMQP